MLISTLMFYGFSLDGQIGKMEGFFFVAGLLAFISISISYMRNEDEEEGYNVSLNPLLIFVFFILEHWVYISVQNYLLLMPQTLL